MSSPKPQPKVPERIYKVGGHTVSKQDYERFVDEMKTLAQVEHQYWKVCREGMRPWRRY